MSHLSPAAEVVPGWDVQRIAPSPASGPVVSSSPSHQRAVGAALVLGADPWGEGDRIPASALKSRLESLEPDGDRATMLPMGYADSWSPSELRDAIPWFPSDGRSVEELAYVQGVTRPLLRSRGHAPGIMPLAAENEALTGQSVIMGRRRWSVNEPIDRPWSPQAPSPGVAGLGEGPAPQGRGWGWGRGARALRPSPGGPGAFNSFVGWLASLGILPFGAEEASSLRREAAAPVELEAPFLPGHALARSAGLTAGDLSRGMLGMGGACCASCASGGTCASGTRHHLAGMRGVGGGITAGTLSMDDINALQPARLKRGFSLAPGGGQRRVMSLAYRSGLGGPPVGGEEQALARAQTSSYAILAIGAAAMLAAFVLKKKLS